MENKEKIEKIIAAKGITVEELAAAVGISPSTLRNVAKGKIPLSRYGTEKLDKYCADNNITIE